MNKTLAYLFGDSQLESELDDSLAAIEQIFEQAEDNPLRVNKAPLAKALKALGFDVGSKIELDPEGLCVLCDDDDEFRAISTALFEPVAMERLAELGWVAARLGDQAMTGEAPDYRIRFIEIDTADTTDADNPSDGLENVIKKGREFATTAMPDDPDNPVMHTPAPWKKTMGVGKASSGDGPKGTPKGAARKEAKEIASKLLKQPLEEAHPEWCKCGFCKNKGKIADIVKTKAAAPKPEPAAEPEVEEGKRKKGLSPLIDIPVPKPPKK